MRLICQMIGHRRSRKYARPVGERWVSHCRFCGEPMVRLAPKAWSPGTSTAARAVVEAPLPLFEWEQR